MSFGFLRRLRGPLLGAAVASLVFATAGALAGSGVNGVFNLGVGNTVDAATTLTGTVGGGPQLQVDNLSPTASSFGILGRVTATGGGANSAGVRGVNATTGSNGVGVLGVHNGAGIGVLGQTGQGTGVFGKHTGGTATNAGVEGDTSSQTVDAAGILGKTTSGAQGTSGVRGVAGGEAEGVTGISSGFGSGVHGIGGTLGIGVFGEADGTGVSGLGAIGVEGQSFDTATDGIGVHGATRSPGDNAAGVLGEQLSQTGGGSAGVVGTHAGLGFGVRGVSTDGTGAEFVGELNGLNATGTLGAGVFGTNHAVAGIGVEGIVNGGATAVGVLGINTLHGLAGKFDGDVEVTGKLRKDYKAGSASSLAIPIAYGSVKGDGTLNSGTPNVATSVSGSVYSITIAGETYTTAGYITVITPSGGTAVSGRTSASATGQLQVRMFTAAGSNTTAPFSFITYKP
jgi:hypothetical protein